MVYTVGWVRLLNGFYQKFTFTEKFEANYESIDGKKTIIYHQNQLVVVL